MRAERKRVRARKRLNAKATRKANRVAQHKIALSQWRRDAFLAETKGETPPARPVTPPSEDEDDDATDSDASSASGGSEAAAERAAGDWADEADVLSMNYAGKIKVDKKGMMNPYSSFKFTSSMKAETPPSTRKARRENRATPGSTPTRGESKDAAGFAKREAVGQDNPLGAQREDNPFRAGQPTKKKVHVPLLGGGMFSQGRGRTKIM